MVQNTIWHKEFPAGKIVSPSSGVGDTAFDLPGPVYPLCPVARVPGSTEAPPAYRSSGSSLLIKIQDSKIKTPKEKIDYENHNSRERARVFIQEWTFHPYAGTGRA